MGVDRVSGAPSSYEDFWIHYRRYVVRHVLSMGIPLRDAEDVASEIMTTFMDRGMLEKFEPDKLHDISKLPGRPTRALIPGPQLRPARFTSYLRRFTFLYCLSWRDKINNRDFREPLVLDGAHPDGEPFANGIADERRGYDLVESAFDCAAVFAAARPGINRISSRSGHWDMASAFEACAESVASMGVVNRSYVASRLGISSTSVGAIIVKLRVELLAAGAGAVLGRIDPGSPSSVIASKAKTISAIRESVSV